MFELNGKTALVTGATGGIGAEIARALHAQGAYVVLSGTREAVLQDLAKELGERAAIVPANLADTGAVDGLIAAAEAAGTGQVDILVANAGVTKDNLLLRMKDEEWETVQKVNLESYFRLSRAAVKGMMKRRNGRIIGITSVVGVTGNPGQTNYAASKAGMIGFSKALAQEVATRNITVNLRGARLHREPDDRRPERAAEGANSIDNSGPTAGTRRGNRRRPAFISPATRPPMSPARPCTSTAGWR